MKRKIFWSISLIALITMILTSISIVMVQSYNTSREIKLAVKVEVDFLANAMTGSEQDNIIYLYARGNTSRNNRVTLINNEGEVLYDSYTNTEYMDNHGDRPEVIAALESGEGEAHRLSDTLRNQTYYSARQLLDGSVIRVSNSTKSALAIIGEMLLPMALLAITILAVVMFLSEFGTKKIIEPINNIDPEKLDETEIYDELSPLIHNLKKQKRTIKEKSKELKGKQEEFIAITENMKEGFVLIDSRADLISYNTSAMEILGIENKPMKDELVNILSFNRTSTFRHLIDEALKGNSGQEVLFINEKYYEFIAHSASTYSNKNGVVLIILDVTERKGREQLRREFSANVSHELKTPLTSISGYAEIMKNGMVQAEDMPRFAEKIYTEAQRLIHLVGDIIRISQLDEEKVRAEATDLDLFELSNQVVLRLKEKAELSKIDIQISGESAKVKGVAQIIDEMVFNLCENAIKYNKENGYVKVTVGYACGHPQIEVKDNGIGIPEADKERIFERFYRVDKSHSKQIGGTGLGLSIVKHGAAYHKAQVELETALGKGTTVKIVF